uniref:Uncharacterized protein n=1 Tax=Caenorhabditis japonica TaxID=281687 RepID=A0A8R1HR41_CAEJA
MPDHHERRATSAATCPPPSKSSIKPAPVPQLAESPADSWKLKSKRFSLVHMPSKQERRVTIRPYESFRERKDDKKDSITFGYAALSANEDDSSRRDVDMEEGRPVSPSPSIFSIYGDEPGPSTICEQPVGAQADVFIASLGEKKLSEIRKYLDSTPREEHMYFLWVKDTNSNKKSKLCRECMCRHKKFCLLLVWLAFVLFLCLVVVLGSLSPDDRVHPFAHNQSRPMSPQSFLIAQQPPPQLSTVLLNTSLVG